MRNRNKISSFGLLTIIISILFISGFIQINITTVMNRSNLDSNRDNFTTIGDSDMNYTIYGHPSELTVTKSESVIIDIHPNGSIKSQRVTINFEFDNDGDENCSFDLIDRAEYCDLNTIKFQKGTFPNILEYEVINAEEDFGVLILKWSNISVKARSRAKYGYTIASYKPLPIEIETEYYINGSLAEIDPTLYAFNASVGTRVSNIIRVRNIQQDYFSNSDIQKPMALCLITLMLPFEEEEEDRDFEEPIFNPEPIMTNEIGPIQQLSWLALGDVYEVNWSTVIRKGGGWGIIELQPIRVDLIQSADIMGFLFDGLSGLLGLLAAQQAYWASLTLMAMIEELTGMMGIFQIILDQVQVQLGMLMMLNFSLISSLLVSLIELDMMRTSLYEMYWELNSTYYSDIINDYDIWDDVRSTFRTVLGINEFPFEEGLLSNGSIIGIGVPYMSLPLAIKYLEDIERRIIASFGAQLIEIMGSPAVINITSTTEEFLIYINATVFRNPDNTNDFYTCIDVNISFPIEIIGIEIISLNLTRRYEFELNNVPGDRPIFSALDDFFGHPTILFPYNYQVPGSPGSDIPGFYTWMLDMVQIGRSTLWWTIGNLTRSLATMMLLLDSSFSDETLDLFNATLMSSSDIDLSTPITLETGFTGLSDLLNIFSDLEDQFRSPFGSPFSELIPDMDTFDIPSGGSEMELLNNSEFYTALKIYFEPVARIRQLLQITLPITIGNITGGIDLSAIMGGFGIIKSAEDGHMSNWNWFSDIVNEVIQTNLIGISDFKRFEFQATGSEHTKNLTLVRDFNYTIPASKISYRFKINDSNPDLSVIVVSKNGLGEDVYAIQEHNLSNLLPNTWYDYSYDLRSTSYWEYYDASFDPENIRRVELRIIPHTTTPVAFDVDYIYFSREILPYPYDFTVLDNYLVGDGVDILPNITVWEKWTSGLIITDLKMDEMSGDGINDIVAGSNDGNIYLLDGSTGNQIWNFSADGEIINILLEDINGDPTPEVIFGTRKGTIYIINKTKDLLWEFYTGSNLDYFIFGNLTGSGNYDFIIGQNDNITAFNYVDSLCWNTTIKGTIRALKTADLDRDGLEEIEVASSKYKIYVINGTNGDIIWDYITEERPTYLETGNFWGDSNKELLYSTEEDYCVILDGLQGIQISNFTADSIIWGIDTANLTGDEYDDILLHTGLIVGHNLSAISVSPTFDLLWNFTSILTFNTITISDCLTDNNFDEILVSTINNRVYILNSSGMLKLNFTTPKGVNKIITGELTQDSIKEFIFGLDNNHILVLNGTDQEPLWITELGEEIITFQFIRTDETIQLIYNLPDPITDILDLYGTSLSGTESLTNLFNLDLSVGLDGIGSIEELVGFDLSSMNITIDDLPISGLGLINMLEFEISLIADLQDMKDVSAFQRAFTGVHEVRYTDKDTINYQLYPIITDYTGINDTTGKYIQYRIRNYEENPITIHYFALNMTLDGQPLPLERFSIEGWNGVNFVDLGNNPIYNITLAQLGLNYTDGKLLFTPYLELEELEKTLLTIDWLGRELRINVNTTNLDPNDLSIEPWIDLSIELSGIDTPGVSSIITFSKTHPTFIVTSTPIPNMTEDESTKPFIEVILTSPIFWAFLVIGLTTFFGFGYMQQREQKEVKTVASKKIIKWLKGREKSWQTLVKANVMTESQIYELKRIRYRVNKTLEKTRLEITKDKILSMKLIGNFISTVFLMRFWRGVNKKSRLISLLNSLEHTVLDPLKHAWATFKTTLGYLNPWDMDRQRKRELQKKSEKKRYWKKIEPPRKPIQKKRIEIHVAPPTSTIDIEESKKLKIKKSKKKKRWEGQYRNDGGIFLKKINESKKLPLIGSREGQIFYSLSKRKYVGMSLKQLSKDLKLEEYEVLVSLIRLFEKGLIFLLQEGKTLSDDLWDVTTTLRKYDPELEKMIDSVETLEDEITEGMEFLRTEIKNENNRTKKSD